MTTISSMTKGFDAKRLLPPREALERYFALVALEPCGVECVALESARGRVLARRIEADDDYPTAARSAMDGFAIRSRSTPGAQRVVGDVRIGAQPQRGIANGEAMKISTGAMLPEGADAVVPVESVREKGGEVHVEERIAPGDAVVARGADMRAGEALLEPGRRIGGPELALLAALGVVDVPVYRRPVVAVISSGDELVAPSLRPGAGEVRDANRYAIAASLEALGVQPRQYPIVRDDEGLLEAALREALDACDGVVVSGGSSVGEHDLTPRATASLGSPGVVVHGLRVRPGKPTMLAAVEKKPIVGLPGNPLSALMMLEAVAASIFAALAGAPPPYREVDAELASALEAPAGWTWYVPVARDGDVVRPLALRSFAVSLAARASGYVVAGEKQSAFRAGERVRMRHFLCGGA